MDRINFSKLFLKILFLTLIFSICSCTIFLDVSDNLMRNFYPPKLNRVYATNPVKDNVKLSVLWIGHASVLIQMYDKIIIIDPLLTNSVAAVLRRHYLPGIEINKLSQCDIILISHSHADHLSPGSLEILEKKFPNADLVFPDGAEDYLPGYSFNFHKMKMSSGKKKNYIGETITLDSVNITTIFSRHWGGRYGIDGKIWKAKGFCAYIIQYKDVCIYYSGDSSYEKDLFEFIKKNYNVDLALVNIIYCEDCDEINQSYSHLYPLGAVEILKTTNADFMIPLHFGTFTNIDLQIPVLKEMMHTDNTLKEKIKILNVGEQVVLK